MKKIVLIGGGSRAWTPSLVRDMMLKPVLSDAEFVLHDPDEEAVRLVADALALIRDRIAPKAKITIEADQAKAFTKADAFIITISTGGFDSMQHDLRVPEAYSIFHTVGDTSGPGGWARALRNIPVFVNLAKAFNRYAPNAVILNYTNPMLVLTQVLAQLCEGPVVGLCHGLFENVAFFKRFFNLKEEHDMSLRYAGLNHFFWITEAKAGSRDLLAELRSALEKESLSSLMSKIEVRDPMGYTSDRYVADELIRQVGVFPYFGDRHVCEFFPHYITRKETIAAYKLKRTSIAERKGMLKKAVKRLNGWLKKGIPEEDLKGSRETAADILTARFTGVPFIDVGNVPNIGQIDNLQRGLVVETPVLVDQNGFTPLSMGKLPPSVLAVVEPWVPVYDLTLEAGLTGDRQKALQALRCDPVCAHLNTPKLREMGEKLLRANRVYTDYLR